MRNAILGTLAIIVAFGLGVAAGQVLQHLRAGYFYEVRREQTIPSELSSISLKYVTESVGIPFLDPGTSILTLDDTACGPITIYKARRVFQEGFPLVDAVSVNEDQIDWEDGWYRYKLRIERIVSDGPNPTASGEGLEQEHRAADP